MQEDTIWVEPQSHGMVKVKQFYDTANKQFLSLHKIDSMEVHSSSLEIQMEVL
jgi:hypothetical protein